MRVLVVEDQRGWLVAIKDNLEILASVGEKSRDQAIGIAQLGDTDLADKVDDRGILKDRRTLQINPGSGIDNHVVVVLARYSEQLVDGAWRGLVLAEFTGSSEHMQTRGVLGHQG